VPSVAAACPLCGKTTHGRADCPFVTTSSIFDEPVVVAATDPEHLAPGALIGDYVVEAEIGHGGMGTVYRAVHPMIGKRVAVKVLKAALSDNQNAVKRFTLEARAVNEIRHRNLVDIFAFGQLPDGRWYLVMEYLEGQNLADLLHQRGRLAPAEALPIFLEVASALEAAHAKKIVHRDLKPDNVFLVAGAPGTAPAVKLLDFGIAKLMEGHGLTTGPRTVHGSTLGTPHYMSPEQARGQALDGRSDVYALGVLLYRTLTGVMPIDGPDMLSVCRKHVMEMPVRPLERAPDAVSPALDRIIMKMLAKSPEQRPQSAAEVLAALRPLMSR
jgi:serine/threonine-protein kinase